MSGLSHWDAMRNYGRGNGFAESCFYDLGKMVEYRGLHVGVRFRLETFILYSFTHPTDRY